MSCKSALYAANTASQTLEAGNTISFGTVVRRFGPNIDLSGGNVVVEGIGYYDVDANFGVSGNAVGTVTITLMKDGTAIPGATASILTTATTVNQVSIPCIVRNKCCCESEIAAVISGTGAVINNAAVTVAKV